MAGCRAIAARQSVSVPRALPIQPDVTIVAVCATRSRKTPYESPPAASSLAEAGVARDSDDHGAAVGLDDVVADDDHVELEELVRAGGGHEAVVARHDLEGDQAAGLHVDEGVEGAVGTEKHKEKDK